MWRTYRRWKPAAFAVSSAMALGLMHGEPDDSARWKVAIVITVALATVYVVEEVLWIVKKQGRPCPSCDQRIRMKPFRVQFKCPHCDATLE